MQKRIEDKLYVFDLVPFEITDGTDAEVIYVQYEHVAGYKKLNADIADKIAGFNQFVMTVNPTVWAQTEPESQGYSFSLSGYDIQSHVKVYFDDVEQTITDGNWSNVAEGTHIFISAEEYYEWYTVTNEDPANILVWNQSRLRWEITMPAEDVSVTIDYHEDSSGGASGSEGHTLTFSTNDSSKFTMTINGDSYTPSDGSFTSIMENAEIRIYPVENMSNYDDKSNLTVDNDDPLGTSWVATMPDSDYTITIDYNGGESGGDTPDSYTFTFQTNDSSAFDLTINGVSKDPSDGSWSDVLEDEVIIITPKESDPSLYTVNGTNDAVMPTWDNDNGYWSTTMPDHDIHVDIDYNGGNGES